LKENKERETLPIKQYQFLQRVSFLNISVTNTKKIMKDTKDRTFRILELQIKRCIIFKEKAAWFFIILETFLFHVLRED